jgi:hypothetical protein
MILYNIEGFKISATKTTKPKLHKGDWDSISIRIDEESHTMNCSNKNSRSNFYFRYNAEWYRLPMYDDNIGDLFDRRVELFTKNPTIRT